jgi:hypothetical protein
MLSGGQIENISRKSAVELVLSGRSLPLSNSPPSVRRN